MKRRIALAAGLAALAIVLCVLPFVTSNYLVRLATIAFMYVTLASSWNIIGGLTGYPSFATAAFFGLGAYGSGIVRAYASLPAAWLAGAAAAGLFALVIGPAILRLRGHYFAVASLVLAAVLREIVNGATAITGGGMGLNLPGSTLLGVDATARLYYCGMLAAAVATVGLTVVIVRSRVGWALRCIEQNEDAAIVLGINTLQAKVAAFVASAVTTGLAGAIYATWIGYIDPSDAFDDILSIKPIVMAFLGGVGTVYGPVFGAVIFVALEELVWRNVLNFHAGILGIIIVLLLVFVPGGLGSFRHAMARVRVFARPQHAADRGDAARAPVLPS
ncbi:MAG: branched-chain amino acid ABC transporter permease [Xanthobacteraceae bacterium]